MSADERFIQGWKEIATYVSNQSGLGVTIHAAQHWAKREADPLPVRRWGSGRPRVVADQAELDSWVDRQWRRGGQ